MLVTAHLLAGAAIGKALRRRPWLAAATAFGSHFLLDFTPHLDAHALFGSPGGGPTRLEAATATVDTLLGLLLLAWAANRTGSRKALLGGAFLAMLIDL